MTVISSKPFGKTNDGVPVMLYTLKNRCGCEVSICSYGGSVVSIKVPDRNGNFADIALGYDNLEGYLTRRYFFGATVGRCCNRIGNGRFALNGKTYQLECNDGKNHLHGGSKGFDTAVWECAVKADNQGESLVLRHESPDGDANYPGKLDAQITYSLSDENEFSIKCNAKSNADTICNITNHTYFNLAGHNSGSVLDQQIKIYADSFTESDSESIPTGKIVDVGGTPMDFRKFRKVGERINEDYYELKFGGGYDHNFVLNKGNKKMGICAEAYDEKSGRHLTVSTTMPCVQFYSGNQITGEQNGKGDFTYRKYGGMCFETQFAPDAVNHPNFASPVLKAGEKYEETTVFKFDIK